MNLNDYMREAEKTAIHPVTIPNGAHPAMAGLLYCATKLCGESGEVAEHIGKALRDDDGRFTDERIVKMRKELGDVFWYLARICGLLGIDPDRVLNENISKLTSRQERGVLQGEGSER